MTTILSSDQVERIREKRPHDEDIGLLAASHEALRAERDEARGQYMAEYNASVELGHKCDAIGAERDDALTIPYTRKMATLQARLTLAENLAKAVEAWKQDSHRLDVGARGMSGDELTALTSAVAGGRRAIHAALQSFNSSKGDHGRLEGSHGSTEDSAQESNKSGGE
jgi:hypothetical protein